VLEDGRVTAFAQEVRACALGQAAAAVLGQNVLGASVEEIVLARDALAAMLRDGGPPPPGRFSDLAVLQVVKDYPARHASTLLAFEAAVEAAAAVIPIVYAANFAAGVNLVIALAERMAAALPAEAYDAEIVEMHHRQKVDAPSGTAIGIGRAVAKGRGTTLDAVIDSGRDGHTGPRRTGAIGFAALRGGQVVGEHTLIFAAGAEHIALTHRAFDRRAYATGAVRAALWLNGRPPGLYAMMDVLEMQKN